MTMHVRVRALAALTGAALLAAITQGSAQGRSTSRSVKTPDGLTISAQEWGNPNGPEIVLIHGFGQEPPVVDTQVDSDLAKDSASSPTICAATAIPTSRSTRRAT